MIVCLKIIVRKFNIKRMMRNDIMNRLNYVNEPAASVCTTISPAASREHTARNKTLTYMYMSCSLQDSFLPLTHSLTHTFRHHHSDFPTALITRVLLPRPNSSPGCHHNTSENPKRIQQRKTHDQFETHPITKRSSRVRVTWSSQ